ncbi:phosphotransferase family protein [Halopiger xanaduensis]|uniref:Aminoglycoside phosphotransferase n=1 Tax=Halopiger xanaduensis (strain DSM 18323 / JCM 14033 / SH-6) TaxID=797210 RepID=F8D999_HALXS|nr:phosphotransferase family protein [Halopiger xanaduensis]AEH36835.1 aminoglycoside phosphotransferase [Halopiger xanaduensis SH-6]
MTGSDDDFDATELESYLAAELDVDVTATERLHEGLNVSVAISTAEAKNAYVLRKPDKLRDTGAFNSLRREFDVLQLLEETTGAAPEPVLLCEDDSIVGAPFLLTTYLEGEPVRLGSYLPERFRNPDARRTVSGRLIETLAELHSADAEPFEEVCERRRPQAQLAHGVDRLEAVTSETDLEPRGLWDVADWLERNVPTGSRATLVHGDYRPSNVLFAGDDHPELSGVLDWETAFLGDPVTELGYLLLRWRDDGDPTPSLGDIEARHSNDDVRRDLRRINERGLAPFTNEPGSPSRRELVARYEERTGFTVENERFYLALAAFLLATVWADVHRHQIESGTESTKEPYVEYLSMIADSIVSGDFEL